ncbi:putative lipid II flippase FtsW [Candidatus Dojkabacteria bacterium]|nr:putative lipid II flippase FtsW [Candidatus Dojkabacteria bacterium]
MPGRRRATKKRHPRRISRSSGSGQPDFALMIVIGFLLTFGWVMVYSSSVIVAFSQDRTPWFYFLRQLMWITAGLIVGYFLYRFDYKKLPKLAPILISTAIILLLMVLLVGVNINGSQRWIRLPFFDFQPSEFAKLAFVIYLASWLSRKRVTTKYKNQLTNYFLVEMLPFLLVLGTVLVLILVEPDLGTTGIIGLVAISMYFIAGSGLAHNIGMSILIIFTGLVGTLAAVLETYRLERIKTYISVIQSGLPENRYGSGYQLSQVLIAVGSGGFDGLGFGQSKQKFNYLGETAFSDTIFAVIAEEFGFIGSLIVISAFLYISIRGLKIAKGAPDKLSTLLAAGVTIWISLQAFLNIAANVGLIPLTGIPLPFISYGGSSMIITLAGVGLLLNVSRYAKLD